MTLENGTATGDGPAPAVGGDESPPLKVSEAAPLLSQSPVSSDGPLPASHVAEGGAPPPSSWISNASTSINSYVRSIQVPGYVQDAHAKAATYAQDAHAKLSAYAQDTHARVWNHAQDTHAKVSTYVQGLPRATTQHVQYAASVAHSAVHDPEQEATTTSLYFTPLPDCVTLETLTFHASAQLPGAAAQPHAAAHAAQKTILLGAFLAITGFFLVIFPRLPTAAVVLVTGSGLLVAGVVTLASFILTLASPGSYIFLLLAIFHLSAGTFLLLHPRLGAFWLCFIIAMWLIAKGLGRMSAWRSFHSVEAPSMWRSPAKSGITLIASGIVLALLSHVHYLLGILFGWDIFLTGVLLAAAGFHVWRHPVGEVSETAPLVQPNQPPPPSYTAQV